MSIFQLSKWSCHRWSPLPLRLIVGYGFMEHGYAKLTHGPERFVAILQALGVPAPELMAWVTIGVELLGGLAVLLGAFVSLASVPMAIMLLVAMFTTHLQYGFSSIKLQAVTAAGPFSSQPSGPWPADCFSALLAPYVSVQICSSQTPVRLGPPWKTVN